MVSHSLCATLSTVSRWPQNFSISGMNGRFSNSPCSSRVAMISSALRTSTTSPTRRPFAKAAVVARVILGVTSSLGHRVSVLVASTAANESLSSKLNRLYLLSDLTVNQP
jgi:hypothetical protein